MKKILVVLLVLAVAGGVFAQEGEFSFSGKAEIGAAIDFNPVPNWDDPALAVSGPTSYNRMYEGWDGLKGSFGINYNRDGFGAGLTIVSRNPGDSEGMNFQGDLNYAGENFNFQVKAPLDELIQGGGSSAFNELWGNYTFLNGIFFLEVAYNHPAGQYLWNSDRTGAFRNWDGTGNNLIPSPFTALDGGGNTFTHLDGGREWSNANYIAADVRLQGLSFGLMMRSIFRGAKGYALDTDGTTILYEDEWSWKWDTNLPATFVDDVLSKMVFGVKFEMSPIEVAAQFLFENYGIYLGGKWFVGPVTVGLSFMGILGEKKLESIVVKDTPLVWDAGEEDFVNSSYITKKTYKTSSDETKIKVGGGVNYDADGFGAVVKGFLGMFGNKATSYISQIGVEPGFYYNVIPTHLQFKLDAGFYFFNYYANDKEVTDGVNGVQYALQPQLFWNFLGTGAGGYWNTGTGILLRYRMVGGDPKKVAPLSLNNAFDVTFKWSF